MKISCAVIDFDGTLVDSMPYWRSLPMMTLAELGLPEPEGFRERICTRPMWEVAEYLPTICPSLTKEGLRDLWDGMMLRNYREKIALKPGCRELMDSLRARGLKLVLLSATRQPYLDGAVDHFVLRDSFDQILTEEEIGPKHDEETFRRLALRTGCPVEEMLLIEDSPANLRSAVSAGVRTAAVFDESKTLWWEEICKETDIHMKDPSDTQPLFALLEEKQWY